MKNISFILICIFALSAVACKKDTPIGPPVEIVPDYVLPQGDAPDAVNDKIQEYYDTYGSFFLYNYTQKDAFWRQAAGSAVITKNVMTLGDLEYVGPMLDLLHDTWLQFFSDDFLKNGGIPYRVFLADEIYMDRSTPTMPDWYIYYTTPQVYDRAVAFPGMNESLLTMTGAQKLAKKNEIIKAMLDYYLAIGLLESPEGFYEFTDYDTFPSWTNALGTITSATANTPEGREAFYKRGFLPSNVTSLNNWITTSYWWTNARATDLGYYMNWMLQATDEQLSFFLDNPEYTIIHEKYNYLLGFYKDNYGIDLNKIRTTTYE